MKRACTVVVVALAGCGGGDSAPAPAPVITPTVGPTLTVTAAPTPAAPTPTRTRKPRPHRKATPAPTPAATLPPGLKNPGSPISGVARYLKAINDRDLPGLCGSFTSPTPLVCGGPGRHLPMQPPIQAPQLTRVTVIQRPQITRAGRTATAVVGIIALDESGRRSESTDTLRLRRHDHRWEVSAPSPIFYRALNRKSP